MLNVVLTLTAKTLLPRTWYALLIEKENVKNPTEHYSSKVKSILHFEDLEDSISMRSI
jgi:hypothetical protein